MTRMDAPHLTVAIYPDPGDSHPVEELRELLRERGARPDRNGFFIERHRRMLVQRAPHHDRTDDRPVEIVMSAGPLGDPGYPRRQAVAFARYVTRLLLAVTERVQPLYGGIGVESVFPTPTDLSNGVHQQGVVTDPLFVRRDLLTRSHLGTALAGEYRRMIEGAAGTVFASWWPFVDGHAATPGGLSADQPWAGGRILGRVAKRYLLEQEHAAQND